jgi:hypothetical protein
MRDKRTSRAFSATLNQNERRIDPSRLFGHMRLATKVEEIIKALSNGSSSHANSPSMQKVITETIAHCCAAGLASAHPNVPYFITSAEALLGRACNPTTNLGLLRRNSHLRCIFWLITTLFFMFPSENLLASWNQHCSDLSPLPGPMG